MTEHEAREWIVRFVNERCRDLTDATQWNAVPGPVRVELHGLGG